MTRFNKIYSYSPTAAILIIVNVQSFDPKFFLFLKSS